MAITPTASKGNLDTVSCKAGLIAGISIDRPHTGISPCGATGADLVESYRTYTVNAALVG